MPPSLGEAQRLQVVPQRDGDDGEVGGQREHREQRQEVVEQLLK